MLNLQNPLYLIPSAHLNSVWSRFKRAAGSSHVAGGYHIGRCRTRKWSKSWRKMWGDIVIQQLNLKGPGKKNKKKAELEYLFGYNCISLLSPANPTSSKKLKIICSEYLQQQHTMCAILLAIVPNTLNIFHPFEVLWKTSIPWIFPFATPPRPGYLRPGIVSYFLAFPTHAWYAVSTR